MKFATFCGQLQSPIFLNGQIISHAIQVSNKERDDHYIGLSMDTARSPDGGLIVMSPLTESELEPKEAFSSKHSSYSDTDVEKVKDMTLFDPSILRGNLKQQTLSLLDWHEQSNGGRETLRTIMAHKHSTLVTILVTDGSVRVCEHQPSPYTRPIRPQAEQWAIGEINNWLNSIKGDTVLHAKYCPEDGKMYLLDAPCLGGIWLTSIPRLNRIELISELMPEDFSNLGTLMDIIPTSAADKLAEGWVHCDDELAGTSFSGDRRLLCFHLSPYVLHDFDFAWVDVARDIYCRVLSKHPLDDCALPIFQYNLGLHCYETQEDISMVTISSRLDLELDSVVRLKTYEPISLDSGEVFEFPFTPKIIKALDDSHPVSSYRT